MASSPLTNVVDLSALPAGAAKFELIKRSVEAALEKKVPSALTVRERPSPVCLPTGVAEVDALCGGIPRGALSEITGPASSGRTSLLHSLLGEATARQEFCALVDAGGSFDPTSAQESGVQLDRVLWVRCKSAELRVPSTARPGSSRNSVLATRYSVLDNVLRVADLLIASGGFGVLALDLGDLEADAVRRIPLTTWFRFRRTVEHTPTAIVIVEQEAHAKSCAEVVLTLGLEGCVWNEGRRLAASGQPQAPSNARILTSLNIAVELVRGHAQKKLAASSRPSRFSTTAAWAG
jgi:hypothetical protein